jgi:hypothetical protein
MSETRLYSTNRSVSPNVTTGDTYYIRVWPYNSSYSGTYEIAFNASNTPPAWTPSVTPIELTANEWEDGNITAAGGEQWFSFEATTSVYSDQRIHAAFGSLNDLNVRLYNNTGGTVGSARLYSSNPYTSQTVVTSQIYYIRVWPYINGNSGTYQIGFNASTTPPPITLPLDATELTADIWEDGELAVGGEQWFSFTATTSAYSGQYIHAAFGSLTQLNVQLYNSTGYTVEGQTTMSSSTRYIQRTVVTSQIYYIRVWPASGSGTYKITFNASTTPPWTEPLNAIPLTVSQWVSGNIAASSGEQWFSFTATADTQYIHTAFGSLTNLYVQIVDRDGTTIGTSQTPLSGSNHSTPRTVTEGEIYYIRVSPYSSSYSGTYQIAFNAVSDLPTWTPPSSTPLTEGQWANGNITTSGGEQWFSFTATAATQYIHFNYNYGSLTDVYVRLYDSSNNMVGEQANLFSSYRSASRTVTPGYTYYIRVWPYDSNDSGTYQIAFNTSNTAP